MLPHSEARANREGSRRDAQNKNETLIFNNWARTKHTNMSRVYNKIIIIVNDNNNTEYTLRNTVHHVAARARATQEMQPCGMLPLAPRPGRKMKLRVGVCDSRAGSACRTYCTAIIIILQLSYSPFVKLIVYAHRLMIASLSTKINPPSDSFQPCPPRHLHHYDCRPTL